VEEMITISRSEYEQLKRENVELRTIVCQLTEEIALLKGGKNSRTSSTAPSHDLGRSNNRSLRQASGKKSGGQPGHKGHTLEMSNDPDEIINLQADKCKHCGEDLEGIDSESYTHRQIVDIIPQGKRI